MLTLPIKKKWFDMILRGEKGEEYREIKPYYISRFKNMEGSIVKLRNGYSLDSPYIICSVRIKKGLGKQEWGAEPNKEYYVLEIKCIVTWKR